MERYWKNKIAWFLHDPVDKAFQIPGHEQRARNQAEAFGATIPAKDAYAAADSIAAGMDRGTVPGYNPIQEKNGAVKFQDSPQICTKQP